MSVKNGDVIVMVGTVKGAFLARRRGRSWDVGGPFFKGQAVYAMAYDPRAGRHRVWAATEHPHFGSVLRTSDDFREGVAAFLEGRIPRWKADS